LPFDELQAVLTMIRSWAGHKERSIQGDVPLTNHQINEIKNHHLFDIGIHTVSHPSLSSHPREFQFREIDESKQCLKRNFRHYKNIITYPYGDFNETTLDVVKCQNLSAGFTTRSTIVTNRSDPYQLGRFQVMNWDGAAFENHITKWMRNK
jgi:peptidoglycan/xylan/chitin deacetylase (PgdA/CDA1 family)